MMLRSLLLFLALLPTLSAQAPTEILIGTWNIEFLGADPKYRRDTPARSAEDLVAIGRMVAKLGVAVLAVQEICGEAPLRAVAAAAGPTWRAVLGTSGSWSDGKTQQGVGFLYDQSVLTLVHAEELLDFPSERDGVSVFHRKPVTAVLRHRATGCDFRIVVVHLKAGRKDRDRSKRKAEATTLREWVDGLLADTNEDRDIVILGDFNSSYGAAPEKILEQNGVMQYVDQQQPAPTIMHFDTPIDQFCVTASFRELQRNSMVVHGVKGQEQRLAWRKIYSDHFPVTVQLLAAGDDDPGATFHRGPSSQVLPTTRRRAPRTLAGGGKPRSPWPPAIGSIIKVFTEGQVFTGRLIHPMPSERGWVVIDSGDGPTGYPMERIHKIRIAKQ